MKTFIYKCLIIIFGFGSIWLLCGIPDPTCNAPWWVWVVASFISTIITIYLLGLLSNAEQAEQKKFQQEINRHVGPGCHYDEK